MSFWEAFLVGGGAAFVAEFLPIHSLRYTPKDRWPEWVSTRRYWLLSSAGCLIGGAVAGGYATTTEVTWYIAANVGAAWPSIFNGLARGVPPLRPPDEDTN
jgi:hypothetical protein